MEAGGFSEFGYTGQGLTLHRTLLTLFLLFPLQFGFVYIKQYSVFLKYLLFKVCY